MKGADFMGNNSENKPDRYINIGIVAHVDAGKTTLSESMLYHAEQSGSLAEWIIKMRF